MVVSRAISGMVMDLHRKQAELEAAVGLEKSSVGLDWDGSAGAVHNCTWLINGETYNGETIHVFLNQTGNYSVQLRFRKKWVYAGSVHVRRVRREISELTGESTSSCNRYQ